MSGEDCRPTDIVRGDRKRFLRFIWIIACPFPNEKAQQLNI